MTRLDAAYKDQFKIKKKIIEDFCPGDFGEGPEMDWDSAQPGNNSEGAKTVTGCRNISCRICWSMERQERKKK